MSAPEPTVPPPSELAPSLARGEGYLGFARNGWQETLGVHMTSGRARAAHRAVALDLPAAIHGARHRRRRCWRCCSSSTFWRLPWRWWSPGCSCWRGRAPGLGRDYGPLPVGRGVSVPPHTEVAGSPPWWALIFTLVADGTLFTSLVFGTLYLWISAPNWPPAETLRTNLRARCRGRRGPCRRRGGGPRIAAIAQRRRHGARLDRPRRPRAPRRDCRGRWC